MEISPALADAQLRLLALRANLTKKKHSKQTNSSGWLDALYAQLEEQENAPSLAEAPVDEQSTHSIEASIKKPYPEHLAIVPDVAIAMLRTETTTAGRVWFLLRCLDHKGSGVVSTSIARQELATKGAKWRVCGWRQLRNLLRAGEGVFWERRDGKIWLRSLVKVAAKLGVEHVSSYAMRVPIADILGQMGSVRATFYASFHAGRGEAAGPISRDTLRDLCGVCERTQTTYEKKRGVYVMPQFAILYDMDIQAAAWEHGCSIFRIKDVTGKFGPAGRMLLARQLPNRYKATYAEYSRPKRRINRQLNGLLQTGTAGNDDFERFKRSFWTDMVKAEKSGGDCFVKDRGKWWFMM